MTEKFWFECIVSVVGGAVAIAVLRNRKVQEAGPGPRTLQALVVCLISPVILALGLEKILSGETIAAMVGALIGYGIPKSND